MKTITFDQAYHLLTNCSAVIYDDTTVTFPCVIDDEEEEYFLVLQENMDDNQPLRFKAEDNQEVKTEGGSIFLIDENKEEVQISLLMPMTSRDMDLELWENKETT